MASFAVIGLDNGELYFLFLTAVVAAGTSLAVFAGCLYWFRREFRSGRAGVRTHGESRNNGDVILTGSDARVSGELVARFKVNHGRHVVSVLEADGKRFIHVNGELSPVERTKMVRYLKSEGFMS